MPLIYLLRHAKPQSDGVRRYIGRTDLSLSEAGLLQAKSLRLYFASREIAAIYHSPLRRSRETAQCIAQAFPEVPLLLMAELNEIDLGAWDGLAFAEVRQKYPEAYAERGRDIAHYQTPKGESFAACQQRGLKAWQKITAGREGQNIVIVGHQGINRCLLSALQNRELSGLLEIPQNYACINIIERQGERFAVKQVNGAVS